MWKLKPNLWPWCDPPLQPAGKVNILITLDSQTHQFSSQEKFDEIQSLKTTQNEVQSNMAPILLVVDQAWTLTQTSIGLGKFCKCDKLQTFAVR